MTKVKSIKPVSKRVVAKKRETPVEGFNPYAASPLVTEDYDENPFQASLLGELKGDTIYIHNISGTEFHIEPSTKLNELDDAVPFEVNETKAFDKAEVNNNRFKRALQTGKLRIVTEEQANKIAHEAKKLSHRSGGGSLAGLAESGLPKNNKAASAYIYECEDIDELEALLELEERENIASAIEARIEELEEADSNYVD